MLKLALLPYYAYTCYNPDTNYGVVSKSLKYATNPTNHDKGAIPWEEWLAEHEVYTIIDFTSLEQLELDHPEFFI